MATAEDATVGQSLDDLPLTKAWLERIAERPAVQRGIDTPEPYDREFASNPEKVQAAIDAVRSWDKPKKDDTQ